MSEGDEPLLRRWPLRDRLGPHETPYRGEAELVRWRDGWYWRWPPEWCGLYARALRGWIRYARAEHDPDELPDRRPGDLWPRLFVSPDEAVELILGAEHDLEIRLAHHDRLDRSILAAVGAFHHPTQPGPSPELGARLDLYAETIRLLDPTLARKVQPADVADRLRGAAGDERQVRRDVGEWWRLRSGKPIPLRGRRPGAWPAFRARALAGGRIAP